jgi:S1-C subfamily serine protease
VKRLSKSVGSLEILKSLSNATAEIIGKVSPSVVTVDCGMGRGSGITWSRDGSIVTCNHVVHGHSVVKVGAGQDKTFEAKVIGKDPYSDVALLKTERDELPSIELGDSGNLNVGQFVIALANPFNRKPSATVGIVTSVGASIRSWRGMTMEDVIVTDARLSPGYSGGPLIDASGKMIGLSAAYVWSRGIAIPVNSVKKIVDGLLHEGRVRRGYLGIVSNTIPLPNEIAEQAEIRQDRGVLVLSVQADSPAKRAGLALGDVIVRFNEKPVTDVNELPRMLTGEVIGKKTKLAILRGEKLLELNITPKAAEVETND